MYVYTVHIQYSKTFLHSMDSSTSTDIRILAYIFSYSVYTVQVHSYNVVYLVYCTPTLYSTVHYEYNTYVEPEIHLIV